ncbi:hypothetical protein P8452_23823 [Trifolium repens]|nr:hydroxyproline-rich glycoprotein family protein [Trifolium repens]WJX35889.1 hypothetical protein P8452_23823 [Trifolium repens]
MEIEDKPYIGFPLGLALLVSLLFFISCFFCCCLHWDKLQCLFPSFMVNVINPQSHIQQQPQYASSHHKPGFPVLMMKENHVQSFPVVMPGDKVPKFIALACPCDPPKDENITIHVQNE